MENGSITPSVSSSAVLCVFLRNVIKILQWKMRVCAMIIRLNVFNEHVSIV